MARKKTITREQILTAAFDLVVAEGFENFTARNIALRMGCSTQPIYLEFESMEHLKLVVFQRIQDYLKTTFAMAVTGKPMIDLALAYIRFAQNDTTLYRAIFIEDHFGVEEMKTYTIEMGLNRLEQIPAVASFTRQQKINVVTGTWIVATGIANLVSSGFAELTQEQMIDILNAVVHDFIHNGRFNNPKVPE